MREEYVENNDPRIDNEQQMKILGVDKDGSEFDLLTVEFKLAPQNQFMAPEVGMILTDTMRRIGSAIEVWMMLGSAIDDDLAGELDA